MASARGANSQKAFSMTHASEVSAARRYSQVLAEAAGFDVTNAGRLAIVVTEAATNILKHAFNGSLILSIVRRWGRDCIDVLAIDRGPGISDIGQSLRDGVSTVGTAGTGLGAMRRLADVFDVYSVAGTGTALYLMVCAPENKPMALDGLDAAPALPRLSVGAVCLPIEGEDACGDAWDLFDTPHGATILVADGLGHGPDAAVASQAAVAALRQQGNRSAQEVMHAMHHALRQTRGAAAAVATLDFDADQLEFVGIGNIAACVVEGEVRRQLVSHNGIVGNNMRKVQPFAVPWTIGDCCIMCSDGIGTQWDLNLYPGLLTCHPALIAGVLYRDFMRLRDDATVVVVKRLA